MNNYSAYHDFFNDIDTDFHRINPSANSFHDLLVFYKDSVTNKQKGVLNPVFDNKELFNDLSHRDRAASYEATLPQEHGQMYWGVCQAVGIFQKLYGVKDTASIDVNLWNEVTSEIVKDNGQFSMDIGNKFENAMRLIGRALVNITNNDAYKISGINSNRKLKTRDKMKTLLFRLPEYTKWGDVWNEYVNSLVLKSARSQTTAFNTFMDYITNEAKITDPLIYFSEKRGDFYAWMLTHKKSSCVTNAKIIQAFSIWFVDEHLVDREEGEEVYIGYHAFDEQRYARILQDKNPDVKLSRNSESPKLPMPTRFVSLCKEILTENDFAFPKSLKFENYHDIETNTQMWCPVNTILFLIMLEIPLRKIQVVSLDSGEGDVLRFDKKKKEWVQNTSEHAGYWKKVSAKRTSRGFLNKSKTNKDKVDLYVNTNKTADRKEGHSETSGYTIPWHNERIIELVDYLIDWQEKHNPVDKPTKAIDLPDNIFSSKPTEAAKKIMPARFYLFRSPLNTRRPDVPVADHIAFKFWHHLMMELEKRLNDKGDDIKIVIKYNENSRYPSSSIFTPHGLRVTGLTALMEAGVPLEVLSKVVAGHAGILMTLHYIKYNNAHISDVLNEAHVDIENSEQDNYTAWLKESAWSDAHKYSIFNDEDFYKEKWGKSVSKHSLFENRQIGICPNGGNDCNTGGDLFRKDRGKNRYGPVHGGPGNCLMCRYLITGKPFLVPMWIKTNELLAESRVMSEEELVVREELESFKSDRYEQVQLVGLEGVCHSLKTKIKQLESKLDNVSTLLDEKLKECHKAYRLTIGIQSIVSEDDRGNKLALASVDDNQEFIFDDEISLFEQMDFMVQAGRLYSHIDAKMFERERDHFIDKVMFNSGMTPITLTPLTDSEKKAATDAAAKYLLTHLNKYEIEKLDNNSITLNEIGFKPELENEIDEAIDAIGEDRSSYKIEHKG